MPKSPVFAPVSVNTVKHNVVGVLTEAIFSGKMKPGERLNESQLARELHVSRAPIREALQQLQEQGLVLNNPRRGMFVVHLEEDDIRKMNSVRLLLEAEALRLCKANLTPQIEAKLTQLLERLEKSESATASSRVKLDFDFHKTIWAACGNEYLERTLNGLSAPLFAHSVLRFVKSDKIKHIVFSHRPLLDFIKGNTKVSAEKIVAEHLRVPWTHSEPIS
jgi:DNA-binding GntR family transcriptional regulator